MVLQGSRKNGIKCWKNAKCCICGDLCSFKGSNEKVIRLECNHTCHEDCLMVSLLPPNHGQNFYDALPKCGTCNLSCVPEQDDMREKLNAHILDLQSFNNSHGHLLNSSGDEKETTVIASPLTRDPFTNDFPINRHIVRNKAKCNDIRLSIASTLKPAVVVNPLKRDSFGLQRARSLKRKSNFGGSRISGLSSIVSSSFKDDYQMPSLHAQRQYFIQAILNSFNEIESWEVDSKYGLLRLVDMFLVSLDGKIFEHQMCYLFPEYLLFCRPSSVTSANVLQFSGYHCFLLNTPPNLQLLDSTTFELTSSSGEKVLIKPYGSDTEPLEKWITALFDSTLLFGSVDFTSIELPDFVAYLPSANNTGTIIVRRQNTINETAAPIGIRDSSVMTSISSILSVKRATPTEFNMVLQLDRTKITEENATSIKNVLAALTWKFSTFGCCVLNEHGKIIKCGTAGDILNSWSEMVDGNNCQQFSPEILHRLWYQQSSRICCNSGVLVVSNASMETSKSCLFGDYRIFADEGKRHANELKVKVGFLNVDYSDKIRELVEIQNWSELLEVVAYSFNLSFEDDADSSDSGSDTSSGFAINSFSDQSKTQSLSSCASLENQRHSQISDSVTDTDGNFEPGQLYSMYDYL